VRAWGGAPGANGKRRPIVMNTRWTAPLALTLVVAASYAGLAQRKVELMPGDLGIPVAPRGLWPNGTGKKLPTTPMVYDTAEGQKIKVVVVTKALAFPWSMAFLPNGDILVTEREGRLRLIHNGALDPKPIAGGPMARNLGVSGEPGAVHGYMDLALHPNFTTNHYVYLTYTKPVDEKKQTTAIARMKLENNAITETKDVFVGDIGTSKIAFGKDGKLYATSVAVGGNGAQRLDDLGGKVLRLNDDGSVPQDNPFVKNPANAKKEIYTLGHRSSLGLAMNPTTGEMWLNENGPNGGDEINILKPGANYGWPLVSYGRSYPGPWQNGRAAGHDGFEPPLVYWMPSIAVSGMAFYSGDKLPKWKGDVFVGSLRTGEIPGTGHVERILFNEKMEELRREYLLFGLGQRIRDVRQSPDGYLYVCTDMQEGAVLKIEPSQ
jgi:glucose/arabinose dehydrogenase